MNLEKKIQRSLLCMNERQRRHFLASEARKYGDGGITAISRISGVSVNTIRKGIRELDFPRSRACGRIRDRGGGRKPLYISHPEILEEFQKLVSGDMITFVSGSISSKLLEASGIQAGRASIARLLKDMDYHRAPDAKSCYDGHRYRNPEMLLRYIDEELDRCRKSRNPAIYIRSFNADDSGQESASIPYKAKKLLPGGIFVSRSAQKGKMAYLLSAGSNDRQPGKLMESVISWWQAIGKRNFSSAREMVIILDRKWHRGEREDLMMFHLAQFSAREHLSLKVIFLPPGKYFWKWRGRDENLPQMSYIIQRRAFLKNKQWIIDHTLYPLVPARNRQISRKIANREDIWWSYRISEENLAMVDYRQNCRFGRWIFEINGFKEKSSVPTLASITKEYVENDHDEKWLVLQVISTMGSPDRILEELEKNPKLHLHILGIAFYIAKHAQEMLYHGLFRKYKAYEPNFEAISFPSWKADAVNGRCEKR